MNAIVKRLTACLLLLTLCLAALPGLGESAPAYDFKKFRWGDSQESVMAVEGTPKYSGKMNGLDANYIAYDTTAVGMDVLLAYYFCDGGLYSVRYILTEEHSVDSLYIDDYNTFKQALTKKYGDPLLDNEKWASDSKKSFYADDKGRALNYGYLSYIDTNGNWIIYREFDEEFRFSSAGVAKVLQNGKWGLLTKEGDYVFPCEYDSLYCCDEVKRVFTVKNGYMNVWDLEGNKIF